MGEEMADSGALGPRRLLEVDDPLLRRDEHGHRGEELGDRGPAEVADGVAMRPCAIPRDHSGGRPLGRPALDFPSASTAGDASPMERTSSPQARRTRRLWAIHGPSRSGTACSWPGARRSWTTAATRPQTPTARRSAASSGSDRRARRARPAAPSRTWSNTRAYLIPGADFDEFGRAHGEAFSEIRPANTTVIVAALVDPRWLLEIEAEAILTHE